jgi:diacylglycerol kinase family enzyme
VDIAVVVNLRARRGSERVVRACRERLPDARVMVSHDLDEARGIAKELSGEPPSLLVSAGGDGTAVTLLNALRDGERETAGGFHAAFGLMPLGTGNAWANATGAPRWPAAIARLSRLSARGGSPPIRCFDLVEVDGTVAPFAGTGWDAEIIDDFQAQKTALGVLPPAARTGLAGYLNGLFSRTIPRSFGQPQVEVEIVNTGDDALTVDDRGRLVPMPRAGKGAVLYRGPTSVCGAATTAEWGFGFRAFPFAGIVPWRFCLRVYAGSVLEATLRMRQLWRGAHPLPNMHTWLLTACTATFSRPVPFQLGGDRMGMRTEIAYRIASERVDVLDWRAIA